MSNASTPADSPAGFRRARPGDQPTRSERLQSWISAILTVLLHLLMLLILLHSSLPVISAPQGGASGGRMKMEFLGATTDPATKTPPSPPPTRAPTPPTPKQPKKPTVQKKPVASRVQTTLVDHAADPVPDDTDEIPTTTAADSWSMPTQAQRPQQQSQAPESPPPPSQQRSAQWGRPPGMQAQDTALDDMGPGNSPSPSRGNRNDLNSAGNSLELGGYQVYYDTTSDEKVRAWMAQGMKEFAIPLPGTRLYMACSLDIALRRGSGKCRALDPDSEEAKHIGDARQIITMSAVYKQGDLVWKGPGPYR
ncbi:type II toxin-antitoxin system RelE/ParE family toxin [Pseudoxanthomonas sp.]|uniref:type II toxin-antitoxin system RelE/ParE family toxin n=1 Tax=Pseudoxanthomonas sp. TaxID=1871049 RepID=UPI0026035CF9|nr:type II toxin-antitoxin system RelE/ParE family toxin [Pseudoxanthomonas sp.]WDS35280.1 MAG: type II toxin-antitoxin system RelE/ParE family toxin [Pseudoxanthomonas sp.]